MREVVKTAIENDQNLIVEGCYIPFNWRSDFGEEYLQHINYVCLVMRREYIENHFADILANANAIERRLYDSGLTKEMLISENEHNLHQCIAHNCRYIEISDFYRTEELLSRLQYGEKLRR